MAVSDDEEPEDSDVDEAAEAELEAKLEKQAKGAGMRKAVAAEKFEADKDWKPPVYPKTPEQRSQIKAAVGASFMFAALEADQLEEVINAFQGPLSYAPDKEVIAQGATVTDAEPALFVLQSGSLDVYKQRGDEKIKVFTYTKTGQSFGELALLYNCPRAATVVASTDSVVWAIDRATFNHCVKGAAMQLRERRETFLSTVDILAQMTAAERAQVADVLQTQVFQKGDLIIRCGEQGNTFYMIEKGSAIASINGKTVKEYKEGDYFGELSLIKSQARAADVVANDACRLAVVDGDSFRRLLGNLSGELEKRTAGYSAAAAAVAEQAKAPKEVKLKVEEEKAEDEDEEDEDEDDDNDEGDDEEFERELARRQAMGNSMQGARKSVAAERFHADSAWKPPVHPKSPEQRDQIKVATSKSFMFSSLPPESLETVILAFRGPQTLQNGDVIIRQGDTVTSDDPGLFILQSGTLDVYKAKQGVEGYGVKVFTYTTMGQSFGELALLYNCPRAATVIASSTSVVWSIDRDTFNHCVKGAAMAHRTACEEFLKSVEILNGLPSADLGKIADVLQTKTYNKGDYIIQQGEDGSEFFMVQTGTCYAAVQGKRVKEYSSGSYFGELALIKKQARAADVVADETPTKLLMLDGTSFRRLLGNLQDLLSQRAQAEYGSAANAARDAGPAAKGAGYGGDDSSAPVAVLLTFDTWERSRKAGQPGTITRRRLLKVFKTLAPDFPEDELQALLEGFGAPEEEAGLMNYADFVKYVYAQDEN
eukprot:TRINITY_DN1743_c0_g1_i1.p1 TRINITY_DN1743_c0_g1~~TRINITY_DN1743_c0_g1_i1.p1  ORF type:complete len:766 (+),score=250.57 TRINITY_DN1743_c0_g1_i1:136-2433(+)